MHDRVTKGCLGCLLVLMVGCQSVTPTKGTPLQQIHQALETSSSAVFTPPPAVKKALLPPLAIVSAGALRGKTEPRFDVLVSGVPAKDFFLGLIEGTPYNMVVHPTVTGAISLQLSRVTVPQVLEIARDLYGYEYERTSYGFKILPYGMRTRIFQINYLNLQRIGESETRVSAGQALNSGNNPNTSGTTTTTSTTTGTTTTGGNAQGRGNIVGTQIRTLSNVDFWKELENTLKLIIGAANNADNTANPPNPAGTNAAAYTSSATPEGRAVVANPQSGVILARAMPHELRAIQEYLDKTQLSIQRQVILEAKILEVELNDGYQAGIDWALLARMGGGKNIVFGQGVNPNVVGTTTNPTTGVVSDVTRDGFGPGLGLDGLVAAKSLVADDIGIVGKGLGGLFSTALNLSDFKGLIQLLSTQGNVQVLSSPQVSTVNNQKAIIRVGKDEIFATGISVNQTTIGNNSIAVPTPTFSPLFSGIALDVTPQIGEDGHIILHIHPSVSEVTDKQKRIPFPNSEGVLKETAFPLASSAIRESDTIVRAQNGQMVLIGGLIKNVMKETTVGLPFLSSIPYFGTFFRQTQQSSVKSELVILLKPRILDAETVTDLLNEADQHFQALDRGFHFGGKPALFGTRAERAWP